MYTRSLNPSELNSFFLFGARGTGKTTFLGHSFLAQKQDVLWIDLLNPKEGAEFARDPSSLLSRLEMRPKGSWVVIDEVQKVPALLDIVHSAIEDKGLLFALTGSSSRKLKHGGANLLAGRAFVYNLYPLTHRELGDDFKLNDALSWGTLPKYYQFTSAQDRIEYLDAYALTYLREEVIAEQLVRKLQPFRLFLEVAAQASGTIVNYSKIARDIGSDPVSVKSYFEILEDTLLGFHLSPFHESVRKRQRQAPKFYFFDVGVKRALERTLDLPVTPQTFSYGVHFEHWLITEIIRLASYQRKHWAFSYLQTKDGAEIDLIIDRPGMPKALIEIKSAERIDPQAPAKLARLAKDFDKQQSFCLSQDPHEKRIEGVDCLHWSKGIEALGL